MKMDRDARRMKVEVMVSIICNAYNHERYISDALDGFLKQKTTFAYEVLVHDDASTDGTADIIRDYARRYPDIVKPICQTENQYSKGIGISENFQYPRAAGKYIAVCEGDDYWTDPEKLQKQVDALERNPACDICAHAATATRAEQNVKTVAPAETDCIFTPEDVIRGGGGFVVTNSLMYRASLMHDQPPFRQLLKLDYTLQIYGALRGGMLYLSDNMSVYRLMTEGSWSRRMGQAPTRRLQHLEKVKKMLLQLDVDTARQYRDVIRERLLNTDFVIRNMQGKYWDILRDPEMMKMLPLKQKIMTAINAVKSVIGKFAGKKTRKEE